MESQEQRTKLPSLRILIGIGVAAAIAAISLVLIVARQSNKAGNLSESMTHMVISPTPGLIPQTTESKIQAFSDELITIEEILNAKQPQSFDLPSLTYGNSTGSGFMQDMRIQELAERVLVQSDTELSELTLLNSQVNQLPNVTNAESTILGNQIRGWISQVKSVKDRLKQTNNASVLERDSQIITQSAIASQTLGLQVRMLTALHHADELATEVGSTKKNTRSESLVKGIKGRISPLTEKLLQARSEISFGENLGTLRQTKSGLDGILRDLQEAWRAS